MPRGWRITKSARTSEAFDGEGARLHGGRWNSPGTPVVYTAQSESLAALELLVHLHAGQLLLSYSSIPVDFDDAAVEAVDPARVSPDWRGDPAPAALRLFGDQWVAEQRSAVLQVRSAVVPRELIYVLNPRHPGFGRLKLGTPTSFQFDARLK
ncbi:MAG TPA: RES family NAD+ phosphorylase [Candidatus Polarisedimenticolaceae bacterium]|nr:RES family NAD+ phosphorylase [Candidatus Polarisedimenticolaceae bacterium]